MGGVDAPVPGGGVIAQSAAWTPIGTSRNADFYEVERHVLAVVPFDGAYDDAESARESVEIQLAHLRRTGSAAGVLVFVDRVVEQSAAARAVYRDLPDPSLQLCFALVGGTPFGRAVGSVFLGLSRPRVPTRLFGSAEEARAWIHEMVARR
jgi:hypothetical protein